MSLTGLAQSLHDEPALARASEAVRRADVPVLDMSVPSGARPAVLAVLAERRPLLVVTPTGRAAEDLASAALLPGARLGGRVPGVGDAAPTSG